MKTDPRTIEDVLRNLVAADEIRFSRDREDYILTKAAKEALFRWKLSQLPNDREFWNFWEEEIADSRTDSLKEKLLCSLLGVKPADFEEDAHEWAEKEIREYHDDFVHEYRRAIDRSIGEQMEADARSLSTTWESAA